ncbi:hypothetical protein QNI16_10585 [Cytophagaceae bacterium YF14B1]|uniref:Uncharacterized protein n=1 Tax=Xanthocytophaga flava TaxID=3048013 RepID=A0AAE3U5L8_9BACT|nr:hypothetical protein [Xanthocytophaga flavus]MDJ1469256.1 hypothetical protein [Xanthocytophaga flavus]MDJ1480929.1 hypothetical protein [Xanthocytophaga flavus]
MTEIEIDKIAKQLQLFLLSDTLRPVFCSYLQYQIEYNSIVQGQPTPVSVERRLDLEQQLHTIKPVLQNALLQVDLTAAKSSVISSLSDWPDLHLIALWQLFREVTT